MLSRNNVLSTNKISSVVEQNFMKKLTKSKIKWIVKAVERREEGLWTIARTQKISERHARRIAKNFKNREPEFKKCGRKAKPITDEEKKNILQAI